MVGPGASGVNELRSPGRGEPILNLKTARLRMQRVRARWIDAPIHLRQAMRVLHEWQFHFGWPRRSLHETIRRCYTLGFPHLFCTRSTTIGPSKNTINGGANSKA